MSSKEERRRGEKEEKIRREEWSRIGEIRRRQGQENKLASRRMNCFARKYFKKLDIKSQEIKMQKKV